MMGAHMLYVLVAFPVAVAAACWVTWTAARARFRNLALDEYDAGWDDGMKVMDGRWRHYLAREEQDRTVRAIEAPTESWDVVDAELVPQYTGPITEAEITQRIADMHAAIEADAGRIYAGLTTEGDWP